MLVFKETEGKYLAINPSKVCLIGEGENNTTLISLDNQVTIAVTESFTEVNGKLIAALAK
jgi:hypothetical protein